MNLSAIYQFLFFLIFINLIYSLYVYKINKNFDNNYILQLISEFLTIFKEKVIFEFFFNTTRFFFIIDMLFFFKNFINFFKITFYMITKKTITIEIKKFP